MRIAEGKQRYRLQKSVDRTECVGLEEKHNSVHRDGSERDMRKGYVRRV